MSEEPVSIVSHISIGTNQFEQAITFYDTVLATLNCRRIMEHGEAVAYGRKFPEFWVQTPIDGQPATLGNGTHFGFIATSKEQVQKFCDAALKSGAKEEGAPGPRKEYGDPYYGCFVRDLDGHKIEAAFWDSDLAEQLQS